MHMTTLELWQLILHIYVFVSLVGKDSYIFNILTTLLKHGAW